MLLRRLFSVSARLASVKSIFPDVPVPQKPLTEYIWENVDKWPNKVAIECGITGRHYKYGELRKQTLKFANYLRRSGLQPGSVLTVVLPNIPEWPIVLLGAIEAGLIVSTANPSYTADELARQLRDSESHTIVTLAEIYPKIEKALTLAGTKSKPFVMIAPGFQAAAGIPQGTVNLHELLQSTADSSDIKFTGNIHDTIIQPYSSGTTGLPKGVMLTHWNIVSNCVQLNEEKRICLSEPAIGSHQDIAPTVLPFFHIYGLSVIMLARMYHGIKLVTLPKFEPTTFFNVLDKHKSTILYVAPPLFLFLISHPGVKNKYFESLRYVLCGAAPLGRTDVLRFLEKVPSSVGVLQAYGMTETSPGALHRPKGCEKHDGVGFPIPNTEVKVTDVETGLELPHEKVGEICIRGPQVMKGYFKRPDETKETIKDGWLHSGDLGYYDKDGCFYIVDRLKELIKVKGYQVAPAELEEVLRSHPDVLDAAVIGVPDERAGEVPKAFIVPKHPKVSPEDITKFISEKVSSHKHLKGGIEFIDSIPKNPSGKILRRILKEQN